MKRKRAAQAKSEPRGRVAVQVEVLWEKTVLSVESVPLGRSFWIGTASSSASRCNVTLPEGLLPASRLVLLTTRPDGQVQLTLLADAQGHIELAAGDRLSLSEAAAKLGVDPAPTEGAMGLRQVRLAPGVEAVQRIGRFTFRVAVFRADQRASLDENAALARRRARFAKFAALTTGLHAALTAAAFAWPAPPVDADGMTEQDRELIQYWLRAAEEDERARAEQARAEQDGESEDDADGREAGSGTRARGEEGSMGAPPPAYAARYGVQGSDHALSVINARKAALRDAADFGMIGQLNSGSGGDPDAPTAPWGRDDALGSQVPLMARRGGLALGGMGHGAGTGVGQGFGSGHGRLGGNQPTWPPGAAPFATEPSQPTVAIDPNGRFATTYRPGRGHLAAFEHAVARGLVPAATRELVSDVGAPYAPPIPLPEDKALAYAVNLERAALPPSGGPVHVRIALRSSAQSPAGRPRLSVHLALDVSGSMEGEPLARAKQAARQLVDRLAPTDTFSLITFSGDAELRVAAGPVGPGRARIHAAIAEAVSGGSTNIGDALQRAYQQATKEASHQDAERVVLLLSDGQPTAGETDPRQLSARALRAFQEGAQTSTFGLGVQYDGVLMSAIAADGGGGYYYLSDAEQIGSALSTEIQRRLDPVATAVELRVRLREDVTLLRVYGSRKLDQNEAARVRVQEVAADQQAEQRHRIRRDRQHDRAGGMRFFIPAFARDDRHGLLLQVAVPPGVNERTIGSFEIKYKDRIHRRNVGDELPIRVAFASSDAASARTIDPSVARTIQGHRAGEDLLTAATRIAYGDYDAAAQLLSEREQILKRAAETLDEPGLRTDAARLARLRAHVGPERSIQEPRALALLFETAGRSHLQ